MLKAFTLAIAILSGGSVTGGAAEKLAANFLSASALTGEDPVVMVASGKDESGFDQTARSSAGARGMMQLMPRFYGWQPDILQHLIRAAHVMRYYRVKCGPTLRAIVGYRSGSCYADPKSLTFRRAASTYRQSRILRTWLLDTRKPLRVLRMPAR